jgi:hypothetical protein
VLWRLKQLGGGDCLLASELISPLRYLMLSVGLLNARLRSLTLPKGYWYFIATE